MGGLRTPSSDATNNDGALFQSLGGYALLFVPKSYPPQKHEQIYTNEKIFFHLIPHEKLFTQDEVPRRGYRG